MNTHLTYKQQAALIFGLHDEDIPLKNWNKNVAEELATQEGIHLTGAHFEILEYVRGYAKKHQGINQSFKLSKAMEYDFRSKGGLKYLYQLFPRGPVIQSCKLAGVPVPPDSVDSSFGSIR